jgi:hypothetical protein
MLENLFSTIVQDEVNRHQKKLSPDALQQANIIGKAIMESILANIESKKSNANSELFIQNIHVLFGIQYR